MEKNCLKHFRKPEDKQLTGIPLTYADLITSGQHIRKGFHSERIAKIQHSIQNFLDVNLSFKVYTHHKHCDFAKKHVLKNPELLTMFLNILDFLDSGFTQFFGRSQKQGEFHGLIQVTTDHDCFRTYFGMSVRQFEL